MIPKFIEFFIFAENEIQDYRREMNIKWIVILAALVTQTLSASAESKVRLSQEVKVVDPAHRYLKSLGHNPEIVIDHVNSLGYEVYGPAGLTAYLKSDKETERWK